MLALPVKEFQDLVLELVILRCHRTPRSSLEKLLNTVFPLACNSGVVVDAVGIEEELVELRQQAHYWQATHTRACERASFWEERTGQLEATVRQQEAQIIELNQGKEELKARNLWLEHQVFCRKSEKMKPLAAEHP